MRQIVLMEKEINDYCKTFSSNYYVTVAKPLDFLTQEKNNINVAKVDKKTNKSMLKYPPNEAQNVTLHAPSKDILISHAWERQNLLRIVACRTYSEKIQSMNEN